METTDPVAALAGLIHERLVAQEENSPEQSVIYTVLRVLYTTSMRKEESEPLRCSIAYLDPDRIESPERVVADSWNAVRLDTAVPFDPQNLAKLSRSADPGAVVLAVFPNASGKLDVWGFIDQIAVHSSRLGSWETLHSQGMPGLFCVIVNGVGDLTVYQHLEILAALKQDTVIKKYDQVLSKSGCVSKCLSDFTVRHGSAIVKKWQNIPPDVTFGTLHSHVRSAIARILLNIQRYKHGALLITGDTETNLNVRVKMRYPRLMEALLGYATETLREAECRDKVYDRMLAGRKMIPADVFKEYSQCDVNSRERMSEMAACVKFIASLSRVDGLVLLDKDLVVHGFGAEIVGVPEINHLFRASDEEAKVIEQIQASEFGTRHRSMFRYCMAHENSLGFVVSQDGLIRAVMKVGNKLIMWENVQVLFTIQREGCREITCPHCKPFFTRSERSKSSKGRPGRKSRPTRRARRTRHIDESSRSRRH